MILRFINQLLTKAVITLAVFIVILILSGVDPSKMFVQSQQDVDILQGFKGTITDIQNNKTDIQGAFDKINQAAAVR